MAARAVYRPDWRARRRSHAIPLRPTRAGRYELSTRRLSHSIPSLSPYCAKWGCRDSFLVFLLPESEAGTHFPVREVISMLIGRIRQRGNQLSPKDAGAFLRLQRHEGVQGEEVCSLYENLPKAKTFTKHVRKGPPSLARSITRRLAAARIEARGLSQRYCG